MGKVVKKKRVKKRARRLVIFCLFSFVTCFFIIGSITKVIYQIVNKYQEASELEAKLADLEEREDELNQEIVRLQDPDYLARYAREKYFYSKDNELIIRIPTE